MGRDPHADCGAHPNPHGYTDAADQYLCASTAAANDYPDMDTDTDTNTNTHFYVYQHRDEYPNGD